MNENTNDLGSVFCADDDWKLNACINWTQDAMELYVMGYKRAADTLVEYVVESGRHQDSLIYPLAFLYRQYIELRLKVIIKEGRMLLEEGNDFPKHHKLYDLWCIVKQLSKKAFEDEPEPLDLNYAEHVIKEFTSVDPDSFAFRYPTTKDGDKTLAGLRHINIRRLAQHIEHLSNVLETISAGISVYLEYHRDMRSSY